MREYQGDCVLLPGQIGHFCRQEKDAPNNTIPGSHPPNPSLHCYVFPLLSHSVLGKHSVSGDWLGFIIRVAA